MALPYIISTLLYCFHENGDVLLLHRKLKPNQSLWSPPGGKLDTASGESPYACACRESQEELGLALRPTDLHLTGLISEQGYESSAHWLMFLFEVLARFKGLPPSHREGHFGFFPRQQLGDLALPDTDREMIWPLFWRHRGGFFAAHCQCLAPGRNDWTIQAGQIPAL